MGCRTAKAGECAELVPAIHPHFLYPTTLVSDNFNLASRALLKDGKNGNVKRYREKYNKQSNICMDSVEPVA